MLNIKYSEYRVQLEWCSILFLHYKYQILLLTAQRKAASWKCPLLTSPGDCRAPEGHLAEALAV